VNDIPVIFASSYFSCEYKQGFQVSEMHPFNTDILQDEESMRAYVKGSFAPAVGVAASNSKTRKPPKMMIIRDDHHHILQQQTHYSG
jgi:hypothetical protein